MEFIIGADVSSLQAMEDSGAEYFDFDGNKNDALSILKLHGVNCIRLRIWNNPETSFDRGDYCNLENTIIMAKRIKAKGLKFLLDFHYCDSWADWHNQTIPKSWKNLDKENLIKELYKYTRTVLESLYSENAYPDMVQIGNEIGHGILWEYGALKNVDTFVRLLNSGIDAVLDANTGEKTADIVLHIECGGEIKQTEDFFNNLKKNGLNDFDYIGLSYYPYWAGKYENLVSNMRNIKKHFHKPVIIVETAFPYTDESNDDRPNVVTSEITSKEMGLLATSENQRKVIEQIIKIVYGESNGCGVIYWEPVWYQRAGVGASKGIGNEWENQAVFDNKGMAVEGLHAFEVLK